jgi:mitogen-activated protein kinase 1/3
VEEALAHPYLEAYVRFYNYYMLKDKLYHLLQHDPEDEPCAPPLDPEFFEFDRKCSIVYVEHLS